MVQYKPITIEIIPVSELIASRGEISATDSDLLSSALVRRDAGTLQISHLQAN